jgi:general secretion pathway protein K
MATAYVADEGGIALVITLFVLALVTVLVLEYHFDAVVELDLAANYADDVQAYHLALSGVGFARALLLRDDDSADGTEDLWYSMSLIPACFPPQQLLSMAGDEGGGGAIFLDSVDDGPVRDTVSDSQGCVSLRIVDEQGKLPINALMPEGDSSDPNPIWRPVFEAFFVNFQIDEDLLDGLVDWIDANEEPNGIGGAERTHYAGLEHPYEPPNQPMRSLGDLRQIRGFDYETLAKLFPESPRPEAMADKDLGTNPYLTVYGSKQGAKVNLNTANDEVLRALFDGLQAGGVAELVDDLVTKRQEGQFSDLQAVNDLISDAAVQTQLKQVADVKSHFFRVESLGKVGDIKKRVVAVLERQAEDATMVYFKVE